jgi:hypothetical protein
MRTRVRGDLHRGFVLRTATGDTVYDAERDARYGSDEAAIERARDIADELYPGQHLIAEVVLTHGFKLVLADAPTNIVYAAANPYWDIPDAMNEGRHAAELINNGTHQPARDSNGTWRLEPVPERDDPADPDTKA